jgi:hypothetical protein
MIVMKRPLATFFVGAEHDGRTHYIVTYGGEWFGRCEEAGNQTRPVKFGRCTVHLSQSSHLPVEASLTKPEQAQLAALEQHLEVLNAGQDFSVDCYFGLIHLCIKTLDATGGEDLHRALGLRLTYAVNVAVGGVTEEAIGKLMSCTLMSESHARDLLERISQ